MSTDAPTPRYQEAAPPRAAFPWRALLISLGIVVLFGALMVLAINTGSPVTGGSALIYAPAAFLAGLFSFLSPCTLPILPAYFAFTFQAKRERVALMTVAFFLGLATTIVALGASATLLSQLLFQNLQQISLIGGLVVVVFGIMSLIGRGFNGMQTMDRPAATVAGSYLYGATFAFGWSACVGPIYGALLTLLTTQGIAVLQGAVLAFIYALGIGSPLILVSSFFGRLGRGSKAWDMMRGRGITLNLGFTTIHTHTTSIISGVLMITMGILLATGKLNQISLWTQGTPLAQWVYGLEEHIREWFNLR